MRAQGGTKPTMQQRFIRKDRVLDGERVNFVVWLINFHSFGGNTMNNKTIRFTAHRSQLPEKERPSRPGYCNNPPSGAQASCYMVGRHPTALASRHQLFQKFTLLHYKGVGFYRVACRNCNYFFCLYLSTLGLPLDC